MNVAGRVWCHFVGARGDWVAIDPVDALRRAGIDLRPLDGEPDTIGFDGEAPDVEWPGIVFVSEPLERALPFLREASRGGRRVLAVVRQPAALQDSAAWSLLEHGASDILAWSGAADPVGRIVARLERWESVDRLVRSPLVQRNLIGKSPAWIATLRQVVEVARFTDASILLLGESGTGKELIARLIHSLDPRPGKRELIVLDCTTIVPELAGSEFFGHERGAFTGADGPRDGAFALAHGGTLFLDEVGDLPLRLQAQILRAVQERTYKRVGGNRWFSSDFRLISATHRPLADQVERGEFRADLYYRLAAVICRVPALRDRPDDIITLFRHFLARYGGREEPPELEPPVRRMLLARRYPGNVRELEQLARRVAYRHVGDGPVTMGDIPEDERPAPASSDLEPVAGDDLDTVVRRALAAGIGLKEISRIASETAIRVALREAGGNVRRAAQRLGVTDRALQMRRASRRESRYVRRVEPPTPTTG